MAAPIMHNLHVYHFASSVLPFALNPHLIHVHMWWCRRTSGLFARDLKGSGALNGSPPSPSLTQPAGSSSNGSGSGSSNGSSSSRRSYRSNSPSPYSYSSTSTAQLQYTSGPDGAPAVTSLFAAEAEDGTSHDPLTSPDPSAATPALQQAAMSALDTGASLGSLLVSGILAAAKAAAAALLGLALLSLAAQNVVSGSGQEGDQNVGPGADLQQLHGGAATGHDAAAAPALQSPDLVAGGGEEGQQQQQLWQ